MQAPTILFEDQHLLVIDKPAGLLSQGEEKGEPHLVEWAQSHVGRNYIGLVHPLDRNTSGAMVLAKRSKSAARLTEALQSGTLVRKYLALVQGEISGSGHWKHLLLKDESKNTVRVVKEGTSGAKWAGLRYTALQQGTDPRHGVPLTLLELELETGRSHQIRVQAAHEGHPLAGDTKYGKGDITRVLSRPALHSWKIEFPHPMSGETMKFEAKIPKDIQKLIQ